MPLSSLVDKVTLLYLVTIAIIPTIFSSTEYYTNYAWPYNKNIFKHKYLLSRNKVFARNLPQLYINTQPNYSSRSTSWKLVKYIVLSSAKHPVNISSFDYLNLHLKCYTATFLIAIKWCPTCKQVVFSKQN